MRLPWTKSKPNQLELLDADPDVQVDVGTPDHRRASQQKGTARSTSLATRAIANGEGHALLVPLDRLCEDPNNPRTEFPPTEIDELADDIGQHGILQPLVVHPADAQGRYRIHFGAKRLRAAKRAGLAEVPVVVRDAPADPYAQVAENQKRHGLTLLDLARFIKGRAVAGDTNNFIAKRLGMNLTTVAHHLSLLDLPPVLDQALSSGRCTSPRTLHELSKLHEAKPDEVKALVEGESEITRHVVTAMKAKPPMPGRSAKAPAQANAIARANAACDRLERSLDRIDIAGSATADLLALQRRVAALTSRCSAGV